MSVNTRMPNAKVMCLKPFSWAKNERKLFFDGRMEVERTALSESGTCVTSPGLARLPVIVSRPQAGLE